jgi:tripartite-type tricarboxylate transporter receptor subunit TctC
MRVMQRLIAATMLCAAAVSAAQAQNYPTKPIQIVVPFGPGGLTDVVARQLAAEMSPLAGQPVIVEGRPGGGGLIAVEHVAKTGSDGHAVCFCSPTIMFMPAILDPNVRTDPLKVLTPVIHLFDAGTVLSARPGLPVASFGDLVALAKKTPGQVTFGSAGTGTKGPYPIELLLSMTGISFNNISYKGEQPIITDMLGDRLDVGYLSITSALQHLQSGRLKPIAALAPSRIPGLPNVPTAAELVPGYDASIFLGLFAASDAPRGAIERLNEIAGAALKAPALEEKLRAASLYTVGGRPEAFAARVRTEAGRWAKLMK